MDPPMAGPGTLLMGLGIAYGLATRWKIYSISSIRVTWMSRRARAKG